MRMTRHTLTVLTHLTTAPKQHHYGYTIIQTTHLPSSVIYPTLVKLLQAGWLTMHEEPRIGPNGPVHGRRLRRYYQLTPLGLAQALTELAKARVND